MHIKSSPLIVLGLIAIPAQADTVPTLIDRDNPARVSRAVARTHPSQPTAATDTGSKLTSTLTMETPVVVNSIQFLGTSRYDKATLQQYVSPLTGKTVPLRVLIETAQRITDRYKEDGYPLSFAYIPANNFQQGVLKIVIVEGYLSEVKIDSDNAQITKRLNRLSAPLLNEKPLTQSTFDRYSILMSRIPDAVVIASASLPKEISGATRLEIKSSHPHYWNLNTAVDSRDGEHTAFLSATVSGLTPYGEQIGVATLVPISNDDRKNYLGLNYQQYLTDSGLQLQLKGSYYEQRPKKYERLLTLPNRDIDLEAKKNQTQYNAGVTLNYPLVLTQQKQWSVSSGVDYTDKKYDYKFQLNQRGNILNTYVPDVAQSVRYPAAEIGLNGLHNYQSAYWALRLNVRQGMGGDVKDTNNSDPDLVFTRWRASGDVAYLLTPDWRLSSSVEGVWSDNDLPESERVSFGGLRFGRGYPDGEASGDYGYGGQVEIRYFQPVPNSWISTVQPYIVVDTAHTYFNLPMYSTTQLASYALGATFADNKYYSLSLEGARPIAEIPSDSTRRSWRFNLTFTYNLNSLR